MNMQNIMLVVFKAFVNIFHLLRVSFHNSSFRAIILKICV